MTEAATSHCAVCTRVTMGVLGLRLYLWPATAVDRTAWSQRCVCGPSRAAPLPESPCANFMPRVQLLRLSNGLLVVSSGRYGLFMWIAADGVGEQWQTFNVSTRPACMQAQSVATF